MVRENPDHDPAISPMPGLAEDPAPEMEPRPARNDPPINDENGGGKRDKALHICEAVLFAAGEPVEESQLQEHLGAEFPVRDLLDELAIFYDKRGMRLEHHGTSWVFRTNPAYALYLTREQVRSRQPSKAALETLAIIAYRQPVTRAEIEEIRGVAVSSGTMDILLDAGWIKPAGRRDTPGRPVTWVTTSGFLDHFDLGSLDDLPRLDELDGAGLLTQFDNESGESGDR